MEGRVPGTESSRARRVGAADDSASTAIAVQPSIRSVRAGPARSRRLCEVVHRTRFSAAACSGCRRAASPELPAISAAATARFVFHRTSDGKAPQSTLEQLKPAQYGVDHEYNQAALPRGSSCPALLTGDAALAFRVAWFHRST